MYPSIVRVLINNPFSRAELGEMRVKALSPVPGNTVQDPDRGQGSHDSCGEGIRRIVSGNGGKKIYYSVFCLAG